MSRPFMTTKSLLWAAMAVASLIAACGGSVATSTPKVAVSPSARVSASTSPVASPLPVASTSPAASPSATAAASDLITIGLPHIDAALEDLLPSTMGGISLTKFSEPVSSYDASSPSGDKLLYPAWLVTIGKTPDDVNIAIAWDPLLRENFIVHAIKVPGVGASTLISTFSDAAGKAGWPVSSKTSLPKPVLEVKDPTAPAGGLNVAYVYAKDNVLYVVVTDDLSLLIQGLAGLP